MENVTPELIQKFSNEFDVMIQNRHEVGAEKYGPLKFLQNDTMQEALYELADLANYARYTFIRIRLLQELSELKQMDGEAV